MEGLEVCDLERGYGRIVEGVRGDLLDEFLKVRDISCVPYF